MQDYPRVALQASTPWMALVRNGTKFGRITPMMLVNLLFFLAAGDPILLRSSDEIPVLAYNLLVMITWTRSSTVCVACMKVRMCFVLTA
jgi:hypothetical protein